MIKSYQSIFVFLILSFYGKGQEKHFLPFNTKDEILVILKNYSDTTIDLYDFQIFDTLNNKTLYFADGFLTKCTINQNCLKFEQSVRVETDKYVTFLTSYLILNKDYYNFFSFYDVPVDVQSLTSGFKKNFLAFFKSFQSNDLNEFINYNSKVKSDNNYVYLQYYLFKMNFLLRDNNSKYVVNNQNKKCHFSYSSLRK